MWSKAQYKLVSWLWSNFREIIDMNFWIPVGAYYTRSETRLFHMLFRQFEHLYSPRMVEEIKEEKKWNIKQTNSDMA